MGRAASTGPNKGQAEVPAPKLECTLRYSAAGHSEIGVLASMRFALGSRKQTPLLVLLDRPQAAHSGRRKAEMPAPRRQAGRLEQAVVDLVPKEREGQQKQGHQAPSRPASPC